MKLTPVTVRIAASKVYNPANAWDMADAIERKYAHIPGLELYKPALPTALSFIYRGDPAQLPPEFQSLEWLYNPYFKPPGSQATLAIDFNPRSRKPSKNSEARQAVDRILEGTGVTRDDLFAWSKMFKHQIQQDEEDEEEEENHQFGGAP
jgi:hypothetical protein